MFRSNNISKHFRKNISFGFRSRVKWNQIHLQNKYVVALDGTNEKVSWRQKRHKAFFVISATATLTIFVSRYRSWASNNNFKDYRWNSFFFENKASKSNLAFPSSGYRCAHCVQQIFVEQVSDCGIKLSNLEKLNAIK